MIRSEHDVPPVVLPARPPPPCALATLGELAWWAVGGPVERVIDRVSAWLWRGVLP